MVLNVTKCGEKCHSIFDHKTSEYLRICETDYMIIVSIELLKK